MIENVVFLIASYLAAVIATLAGFGSSALLVPIAIIFMDFKSAIFVVACFHLFNNSFKIKMFWGKVNYKVCMLFGIPSIIFAFIGANLISVIPVETIKRMLALFLIIFSIHSLLRPKYALKESRSNAVIGGSLSGLLAGLIGMGGAIRAAFLIAFNLPKEVYVATSAMIAFVIDMTRIPTYLFTGTVENNAYFILLPFLVISAYLGVKTGKMFLNRINQDVFRRVVLCALLLVGIKLLF